MNTCHSSAYTFTPNEWHMFSIVKGSKQATAGVVCRLAWLPVSYVVSVCHRVSHVLRSPQTPAVHWVE